MCIRDRSDRTEYVLYDLEDSVGAIINGCREENGAITFVADWSPYYSTGDIYEIVWNDGWYETDDGWVYIVKGKPLKGWRAVSYTHLHSKSITHWIIICTIYMIELSVNTNNIPAMPHLITRHKITVNTLSLIHI